METCRQRLENDHKERKKAFLQALYRTLSVTAACKHAKITRQAAYKWRETDPKFRAKWSDVWEAGIDKREQVFDRMAMCGVETKKYVVTPDGEKKLVEQTVRDSPTTALNALQALRPEKWSKAGKQEGPSVHIGVANILALSDEQLARVVAEKAQGVLVDAKLEQKALPEEQYDIDLEGEDDE